MNRKSFFKTLFGSLIFGTVACFLPKASAQTTTAIHTSTGMMDKAGIRRIIVEIKKDINRIAENVVFDADIITTRKKFTDAVTSVINQKYIKTNAIRDFEIICDETTNPPSTSNQSHMAGTAYIKIKNITSTVFIDFIVRMV